MVVTEDVKDLSGKTTSADRLSGDEEAQNSSLEIDLNVFNPDGTAAIADGALYNFSPAANDSVDRDDAYKIWNFSDNLSLRQGTSYLTINNRTVPAAGDTMRLSLNNTRTASYQLQLVPAALPNVSLSLVDKYLGTVIPISLSDTTKYTFSVGVAVASSKAADRFVIASEKTRFLLPVTFTKVAATAKNAGVEVGWKVENERNIASYEVEKSPTGTGFTKLGTLKATGAGSYSLVDAAPQKGMNYYRVKSVGVGGGKSYTAL